jgi:hypothetical protein
MPCLVAASFDIWGGWDQPDLIGLVWLTVAGLAWGLLLAWGVALGSGLNQGRTAAQALAGQSGLGSLAVAHCHWLPLAFPT